MSNSDLIRSLYAAFGRGDVKSILDALDPTIEWLSNGDAKIIHCTGRRDGVAGAASFFQALADNLDFEAFEPKEFFEAGETVIVLGHTKARVKEGGVFDSDWAHVFTLKNGKLLRFREFYDTKSIADAVAA
ncbi:MAG: ketosteroid isomerase [Alphaproteobacteria bacterium]|nr:ketosteroid isomerase [Alphaproteobacteria bacterium]